MAFPASVLLALGGIMGVAATSYYQQSTRGGEQSFPYALEICGQGYVDCETRELHSTLAGCEFSAKMGNMLCNHNDPTQVVCKPAPTHTLAAIGRCNKRL